MKGNLADLASDNSHWTTDEDGAICKLKKDGMSWGEIAKSINRNNDASLVRRRFQYTKSVIEAAGCDTDSIGENWAEDIRSKGREIPSPDKPSPSRALPKRPPSKQSSSPPPMQPTMQAKQPPQFSYASAATSFLRTQQQQSPLRYPASEQSSHARTTSGKESPSVFNLGTFPTSFLGAEEPTKQTAVHARGGGRFNKSKSSTLDLNMSNLNLTGRIIEQDGRRFAELVESSSSSASEEEGEEEEEEEFDHEAEREEQKRFLYHEYWSELYPPQKTYEADGLWSEGDCKVLAVIEAKDKALKLKRMQAEFFNATGRMISSEIIGYKLSTGE